MKIANGWHTVKSDTKVCKYLFIDLCAVNVTSNFPNLTTFVGFDFRTVKKINNIFPRLQLKNLAEKLRWKQAILQVWIVRGSDKENLEPLFKEMEKNVENIEKYFDKSNIYSELSLRLDYFIIMTKNITVIKRNI